MSDPALGLTMLALIVIVIMMGFPTAFTLMGLGMFFGYVALYVPGQALLDNRVFDLIVERTYGAMNNESLISIPLFVLMGYVMERGALVDKMFYSIQLAFRGVPASLAVATLIVCTFWGIASGLVGAVVVLMGVIAFNPMLKAGYDVRLASGVITAGGTLGILIPPSVMIIVYAAVAGQSVVKLYASAMFPGFFSRLSLPRLYRGLGAHQPQDCPQVRNHDSRFGMGPSFSGGLFAQHDGRAAAGAGVAPQGISDRQRGPPAYLRRTPAQFSDRAGSAGAGGADAMGYLVVCRDPSEGRARTRSPEQHPVSQKATASPAPKLENPDKPQELGSDQASSEPGTPAADSDMPQEMGNPDLVKKGAASPAEAGPAPEFFTYFWSIAALTALVLLWYYWKMEAEQFELLKLLISSVMPLGILTIVVLAVILFGITTATESAAIGAAGAFLMGFQAKTLDWERTKQSVFLTAKTTAMVCWLFVGSALFSGVFAILGGQQLVEHWVLSFNLTPVQFMIVSQAIIFVLGWPLEWTEIIVIFVPIFLPLLKHFNIDPILWGTLVFVNLQAAFLSPPVAMSAFYLKGVAPSHVTLNQIFAGMMPYMLVVILCMVIMYVWPGMTLWLPNYLYGN